MVLKSYIIDSFTNELFKGNPAGVCITPAPLPDKLMLKIAEEFKFSETAFILPEQTGVFSIRYFSPITEIPLCGHATLASAKALFSENPTLNCLEFRTHYGLSLIAEKKHNNIEMYFPIHQIKKAKVSEKLKKALRINDIKYCGYNEDHNILMLEIEDSYFLERLNPDFTKLKKIKTTVSGILITALSKRANFDFEYRYFWPWSGSDEDPVTGGVQSFLCKYWSDNLCKTKLNAYQSSYRTGSMGIELQNGKTIIRGEAQIFMKGEIAVNL